MPRFNEIINSFISGEVTPKLYGRSDSEIYKTACRTIKNMVVQPQGGAKRRMGTEFYSDRFFSLAQAKKSYSTATRIIPFNYSDTETYLIIFHADTTDAVSGGYFFDVLNTVDGTLMRVPFSGGVSLGWAMDSIGAGSVSVNPMTSATTISEIQYAQNGRLMFFAHRDLPPFYITRIAKNHFVASDFHTPFDGNFASPLAYTNDRKWQAWPYQDMNVTAITLTAGATTGVTTLTASSGLFTANMVDSAVVVASGGVVGAARIISYSSSTVVNINIIRTFPGTSAYTTWALSAWSKEKGYPRSVTFYNGRIVYGGTKSEPEKIWFSQLGDVFELSNTRTVPGGTPVSSDPGSAQAASTEINEICWLAGGTRNLLIGTRGREYSVDTLSGDGLTMSYRSQTSIGSEVVQPAVAEDTPVYVQRGFRKLREMVYDYRVEGYSASELTFLAEHMPRVSQGILGDTSVAKIKYLQYQSLENSVLWAVDTNGYLFGCTKNRENSVIAFHRHELGGSYSSEYPRVLSIAAVRSANGTSDELWLLVLRTINSASVIYLERLTKDFYGTSLFVDSETRENQPIFVDSARIYRPASANFWVPLKANSTATKYGGTGTGATTGSVSYANDFALFTAASYIVYDGTSNFDTAQTGCIRFTLNYDPVTAGGTATLFNISASGASDNNRIRLDLSLAGVATLIVTDSAGAAIINSVAMGTISDYLGAGWFGRPTVWELNYDITAGATRLFVNGKQIGSTISSTGTRTTAIDFLSINATRTATQSLAGIGISNFLFFSAVQHTAEHEIFEHIESNVAVTGFSHLEGQEVAVLGDGLYLGDETVASGGFTLGDTYTTLIAGLKYENLLETMAIDAGTGIGSAQGSIKRIDRVMARFSDSAAASIGPDESSVEAQVFRLASTPAGDPIELVTDDKVISFPGDYDRNARVVILSEDPLPCNVTCISARGVTGDV